MRFNDLMHGDGDGGPIKKPGGRAISDAKDIMSATSIICGGLVADDVTGFGVLDDVAIPFVMVGGTAVACYVLLSDMMSGGTQFQSKTIWKDKNGSRLDVENPNPDKRRGQIHFQDSKNNKYMYNEAAKQFNSWDPVAKSWNGKAPNVVNGMLKNKDFQNSIIKGLKYLGQ